VLNLRTYIAYKDTHMSLFNKVLRKWTE